VSRISNETVLQPALARPVQKVNQTKEEAVKKHNGNCTYQHFHTH